MSTGLIGIPRSHCEILMRLSSSGFAASPCVSRCCRLGLTGRLRGHFTEADGIFTVGCERDASRHWTMCGINTSHQPMVIAWLECVFDALSQESSVVHSSAGVRTHALVQCSQILSFSHKARLMCSEDGKLNSRVYPSNDGLASHEVFPYFTGWSDGFQPLQTSSWHNNQSF